MSADGLVLVLVEGRADKQAGARLVVDWAAARIGCPGYVCEMAMTYQEAQMFNAKYLHLWLDARHPGWTHVITCQTDGFPYNPEKWEGAFLGFDYIGPPWPARLVSAAAAPSVGSSGCCLRSRAFFQACTQIPYAIGTNDDVWMCQLNRPRLEALGMKFAPVEVAARFAVEEGEGGNHWPPIGDTFAFHGMTPQRRAHLQSLGLAI
jgi:hypothetical protein